jgi:hypothetical protein
MMTPTSDSRHRRPTPSMRPLLITLLLAAATTASGQVVQSSQQRLADQWVFSLSGLGGIPVGEFRKNENGGGGLELMVGFQPVRRQPLKIRGQINWLMYGNIDRDIEEDYCDAFGCQTYTVYYDSRQHMMFTFQAGPELTPVNGRWRPFVYALAGSTVFHSSASVGEPDFSGNEPSDNLFTSANFSTSYGVGIRRVDESKTRSTGFELSAHFTRNAKADYLTERGLTRTSNGTWIVQPVRGPANVVMIKLGFWVGPNVPWFER